MGLNQVCQVRPMFVSRLCSKIKHCLEEVAVIMLQTTDCPAQLVPVASYQPVKQKQCKGIVRHMMLVASRDS
jgi:hypothetical protein